MQDKTPVGTLRSAATIQTERAAAAVAGSVTRVYPLDGKVEDPAGKLIIAALKGAASGLAAPGNRLGASVGPGPESLRLELAAFVRKNFDALIDGARLAELQAVSKEVERERALIVYHSSPMCQQRASQAMRAYAIDPSAANLKKIKEEKTFSSQESAMVQSCAIQRLDAMLAARLPAIGLPVCSAAVGLMEQSIAKLASEDAARYAAWDVAPVASALEVELERLLALLKTEVNTYRTGASGGGIAGLLQTILQIAAEPKGQ